MSKAPEKPQAESAPGLTPRQRAAVEVRGLSVALRAGAGCGKTRVLADRWLSLTSSDARMQASELVALTFTDKAATELRSRVRAACRARLGDPDADRDFWKRLAREIEAATIGTFHGFCAELLREHSSALGADPDFEIKDQVIVPTLIERSAGSVLRERIAAGDADLELLLRDTNTGDLRDLVLALIEKRRGVDFAELAALPSEMIVKRWKAHWEINILPRVRGELKALAENLAEALNPEDCSSEKLRERLVQLRSAIEDIHADRPAEELRAILEDIQARASLSGAKATMWPNPEAYERLKAALDALKKRIKAVLETQLSGDDASSLIAAERGGALARLVAACIDRLDRDKRESGWLDFNDLVVLARNLLRDDPRVRSLCRERIRAILVDEFQDTDPIQAEILELLCEERIAEALFLVGDQKQSIYRFRGARPELFDRFAERFPEAGRMALVENFRAAPELIDFTNALFADEFPGAHHRLVPGAGRTDRRDQGRIAFVWTQVSAEESDASGTEDEAKADEKRESEARVIARLLRERLDAGLKIRDMRTGAERNAAQGDVAILMRSLNDADVFERALPREGLDFFIVGGAAFFARDEVIDVIHVLSLIEDPLDEVALAGALRSPFFAVRDEGLFLLSTAGVQGSPLGRLASGFHEADLPTSALSRTDRRRTLRARELLGRWRKLKDRVSIAELVAAVIEESGYEAAVLTERLGDRKRANLRKLVRTAREFGAADGTLAEYVAKLRKDVKRGPREEDAATADERDSGVRIMTIHQAKGLEFPVVVLPDLNRKPPASFATALLHDELGLVVKPAAPRADAEGEAPPSLGWSIVREIEDRGEKEEAIRLFYTAVTRARDHLILSAALAPEKNPISPALRLLDARFDRATGGALVEGDWSDPGVSAIVASDPRSQPPARKRSQTAGPLALARLLSRRPRA